MSSVLYDVPGPRARRRNRILSVAAVIVVLAALAWVVYRFWQTGQFESLKWEQFTYKAIQQQLVDGLLATLKAAATGAVLALFFGGLLAGLRMTGIRAIEVPATFVVELFRAIPLLILIFFFYYGPLVYGLHIPNFWALVLGLTLYNGAVVSEILRTGIASLPRGQSEAGLAIGLDRGQLFWLILLPQAVRAMLPSIISQIVVLLKDTALGFIITYPELLYVGKQMGSRLAFDLPYVPSYLVVAAVYIGMCSLLSWFANWLSRRGQRRRAGRS
ncbi:amino acid ABC transporter permease [Longispora fulva]|uniref:Glutamate transport system permease protein n=1 Tax=Longispora fulva TaxID=619741 RepID=A0A8J7GKZ8_9ACTN|nr:amino acid ABC transporter permease [Longispora fulva]MBG6138080.1 glutamate transport system permease protein [Longispora fulva]